MTRRRANDDNTSAKPTFRLEALERRLLFSADLPFVVDGFTGVDPNSSHIVSVAGPAQAAANESAIERSVQLVIIDAATPDYQSIIADLEAQTGGNFDIHILDADQDGIAQITALLAQHDNVSALHLISHGADGQITLGDSSLGLVELLAHADEIAQWQDSFTADGDFLIYGCDLAASEAGQNFVTTLGQLTGTDVAASTDLTGAAAEGGNWRLEYTTGAVETRVAVSTALQTDYQHSLATYTVTTLADSGAGSLRQAILDANVSAGADRIEFAVTGTISLTSGLPDINHQLDLDASAVAGGGGAPGITLDGAAAGDTDGLLFVAGSDGSSVKGLAIVNFDNNGIYLFESNNHTIAENYIGTDGLVAQANGGAGIRLWNSAGSTLGGALPVKGNVISGNDSSGIFLSGSLTTNNNIVGNFIGTAVNGTDGIANLAAGVSITGQASFNVIGGSLPNQGNLIAGNGGDGIFIQGQGTNNNDIYGNFIGTTTAGDAALGNGRHGVTVYDGPQNTRIGGDAVSEGNVISGNNASGVVIQGAGGIATVNNVVAGNFIGTDGTGLIAVANGAEGVLLLDGATDNIIGSSINGNIISGNAGDGVKIDGALSTGNRVLGNHIGINAADNAALGNTGEGIVISGQASSNTIGGTNAAQRNVISGNGSDGILLTGLSTTNNTITGNYIGTDAAGTAAIANSGNGIFIVSQAHSNTIGGSAPGQGNLISGNISSGIVIQGFGSDDNIVQGNYIGTTVTGDAALGNGRFGVIIYADAQNNQVGGDGAGEGNVLSGNLKSGVGINGAGDTLTINNIVTGNFIGIDSTGEMAVANGEGGVRLYGGASNNTIGSSANRGNIISGNNGDGVTIDDALSSGNHIIGNYIGVDVTGDLALGNAGDGVGLDGGTSGNFVGGDTVGKRNIVSANGFDGVSVSGAGTDHNEIQGNYIGLGISGDSALGNGGHGVLLNGGASNNLVGGANPGERNIISGNTNGVYLWGAGTSNNVVSGNYIGTDWRGTSAVANSGHGVRLSNSATANIIGGAGSSAANVVSGNAVHGIEIAGAVVGTNDNIISANYIGIAADGETALGNVQNGINVYGGVQNTIIGGSNPGEGNLISGNKHGVLLHGTTTANNAVQGNLIGTDLTGTLAVGNLSDGLRIVAGAHNNTIGGTNVNERNVISGNGNDGIELGGAGTTSNAITGNYIGTIFDGSAALGNLRHGVVLYNGVQDSRIGGANAGESNIVSGNGAYGIVVDGGGGITTINNTILGNFIGTDVSGASAIENSGGGVSLNNGASSTTIGGDRTVGEGNLISGNSSNGVRIIGAGSSNNAVTGNNIGTNLAGTGAIANTGNGVIVVAGASANTIGGAGVGERNLISGNNTNGVYINGMGSTNNAITGNYIGTNLLGNAAIANSDDGISITGGASSNTIGGAGVGETNVISGNGDDGIELGGAGTTNNAITGNYIGTISDGSAALGNLRHGVVLYNGAQDTRVGGANAGEGNIISGNNFYGIIVDGGGGATTINNTVSGNYIGSDVSGSNAIANISGGVYLGNGASNNLIGGNRNAGEGNLISGNTLAAGIHLQDNISVNNTVQGNLIGTDGSGSVSLDNLRGIQIYGAVNSLIGGTADGEENVISGNVDQGIFIWGAGDTNTRILGNYIGTNLSGIGKIANTGDGIRIGGGAGSITIGGAGFGEGNVISGNGNDGVALVDLGTDNNVIHGNYLGTTFDGSAALGNGRHGILLYNGVQNTSIGGANAGEGNTVSGNGFYGIAVDGAGGATTISNAISGNRIGTDASGNSAIANTGGGVYLGNGARNTIVGGDHNAGEGNLISGNGFNGVYISGSATSNNSVTGNYIGTNLAGTGGLGNSSDGIYINAGANSNAIGGSGVGEANVISGNGNDGIEISGVGTTGNTVIGNYVGTNVSGTGAVANSVSGIRLGTGANNNTIGGNSAAGEGNLVSGNGRNGVLLLGSGVDNNVVYGNHIGSDVSGNLAIGNANDGIWVGGGAGLNRLGGSGTGEGNLISGNFGDGISIKDVGSDGNIILGNIIGANVDGLNALSNGESGVQLGDVKNTTVGGSGSGQRNLISGNGEHGVVVSGAAADNNRIIGNYIGTNMTGMLAIGNTLTGIQVTFGAQSTVVGGAASGEGNVISGNLQDGIELSEAGTSDTRIYGNFIGTTFDGNTALANTLNGVGIYNGVQNTRLGSGNTGERNIISGNNENGVAVTGNGGNTTINNIIAGNYVGTNATGTAAVANAKEGIYLDTGASNTLIGGDQAAGHGNVISGNAGDGIYMQSGADSNSISGNTIGLTANGGATLGNGGSGVVLDTAANNIGGPALGAGNIISANGENGILLLAGGSGTAIVGNTIGLDITGTIAFGNGHNGIYIESDSNLIGGVTAIERNLISGNGLNGIELQGAGSNVVIGNFIGTDITGTLPLANSEDGIQIASGSAGNTIGGATAAERNVISGNGEEGIEIRGVGTDANVIQGNFIGTTITGNSALGNGINGIVVVDSAQLTQIGGGGGKGNIISGNALDGVVISGAEGSNTFDNVVSGNYIGTDFTGLLAVGNGQYGISVSASGNTIGGDADSGEGNVISGNSNAGVLLGVGADSSVVTGNIIGLAVNGVLAIGNAGSGVVVHSSNNRIGGTPPGERNIISANGIDGIHLIVGGHANMVMGNWIGTDVSGTQDRGNSGNGVLISNGGFVSGTTNMLILNQIAFNSLAGVAVPDAAMRDQTIISNSIYSNGGLAIDLGVAGVDANVPSTVDTTVNDLLNYPVISHVATDETASVTIDGTFVGAPNVTYRIEFYSNTTQDASGYGEATTLIGVFNLTTDAAGNASFNETLSAVLPIGTAVSATASVDFENGDFGGTSEMAQNVLAERYNEVPVFTSPAAFSVNEKATLVGSVVSTDSDGDTPQYVLVGSIDDNLFSIDAVTGELRFQTAADFEAPADADDDNTYDVTVQVDDGFGGAVMQAIAVTVDDVNDNAPVVAPGQVFSVDENASVGDVVDTVAVSDVDTVGIMQNWVISGGNADGIFQINATTGEISIADVAKLDYETSNQYALSITVGDGIAMSNVETLVVNINNINEAPVFTSQAVFSIDENTTLVGTVVSTDVDGGAPQYALVGSTDDSLLSINAATGELRFQTSADFEAPSDAGVNNTYDVTVQVDDGLGGVVTQLVTVTVNNLNEFSTSAITDTDTSVNTVGENAASGSGIGLTAFSEDLDSGDNVSYSLVDNAGGRFSIDAASGVVSVSAALDFEANSSHVIVVQATSSDSSSVTRSFTISVVDVNDNAPVIAPGQVFSIDENASAGDVVDTVLAADVDTVGALQNWTISAGNTDGIFQINATTGEISIADASKLDYESSSHHTLSITVADGVATSNAETLVVNINDVNEAPVATVDTLQAVEDTSLVIDPLSDLLANDLDPDGDVLSVSAVTSPLHGVLTDNLDGTWTYTPDSNYAGVDRIQYQVSDGLGETRWVDVNIDVASVNDLPTISVAATVNVDENWNGIITQVQATDLDATKLTVSITGGADSEAFRVDPVSGYVSFITSPDYEVAADVDGDNRYELELTVSDNAGGSVSRQVDVLVSNVNEAPAVLATEFASAQGFSGSLGQVQVLDPDSGDVVVLTITGGSGEGLFEIDSQSREIVQHDGAVAGVYTLEVQLTDNSGTVSNAILTIRIKPTLPTTAQANGMDISDQFYSTSLTSDVAESLGSALIAPDASVTAEELANTIDGIDSNENSTVGDNENAAESDVNNAASQADSALAPFDALQTTNSRFDLRSLQNDTASAQASSSSQSGVEEQGGYELVLELLLDEAEELVESVNRLVDDVFDVTALSATLSPSMLAALDSMHSVTDNQEQQAAERMELIVTAGTAVSVSLTVGFVTWLLNSGSLLATALSTSPLWRPLDPVPILGRPVATGDDDGRGAENA